MPKRQRDDSQFWILVLMLLSMMVVGTMSYSDEVELQAEVKRQEREYALQRDAEWRQIERRAFELAGWR